MPSSSVCYPIPYDSPVWGCLETRMCIPGMLGLPLETSTTDMSVLCYHAQDSLEVREMSVCTQYDGPMGVPSSSATNAVLEDLVRLCGR